MNKVDIITKELPQKNTKKRLIFSKKKIIISSILAVAIILLTTTLVVFTRQNHTFQESEADKAALIKITESNKAITMAAAGDVNGAVTLLKSDIANATNYNDLIVTYNKLANVYLYAKNYPDALVYANKAIAVKNNAQSWVIIGQVAEDQKDYQKAVDAYQKAVDLSVDSKDDPRGDYITNKGYLINIKAKL